MCMAQGATKNPRIDLNFSAGSAAPSTASSTADVLAIPKVSDKEHSDPKLEKVLDSIRERQWAAKEKVDKLSPGDMAFGLMRHVPRKDWNTPLADLGHWPRGSSIAEIKRNSKLRNFTPAQAIEKLFEMDDELKKGK